MGAKKYSRETLAYLKNYDNPLTTRKMTPIDYAFPMIGGDYCGICAMYKIRAAVVVLCG